MEGVILPGLSWDVALGIFKCLLFIPPFFVSSVVLRAVTPGVTLVAFLGRGGQQEWAVKDDSGT